MVRWESCCAHSTGTLNRAAHMHFHRRRPPAMTMVITHIFTPDCPYLKEDTVFGVKEDLVAEFNEVTDQSLAEQYGMPSPFLLSDWDFVLAKA